MTSTEEFEPVGRRKRGGSQQTDDPPEMLAAGAAAYQEQPVMGRDAPFADWTCVDDQGLPTGHGEFRHVVRLGEFPKCPQCGSGIAMPVVRT